MTMAMKMKICLLLLELHVYKIQDAIYKYTENKHKTSFFLW